MNLRRSVLLSVLAGMCWVLAATVQAASAGAEGVYGSQREVRARALLERAVRHVEATGETGATAFTRGADFIDRDLYVFALRMDGTFLASGGASAALIGMNVLDETDLEGRPFFREILELARRDGKGSVTYRWFNPADSRGEPKLTLFERVGDLVVAVGFYPPRATPAQARALLRKALDALAASPAAAIRDFQRLDGPFVRDDLYVFVVDLASGRFLAHGANRSLVGSDAGKLSDPDGRPVVTEMISRAGNGRSGELQYRWTNPVTGRIERKHTYFVARDGRLVGVGYFDR